MRIAYVCADPGIPVFGRKGCSIHVQEVIRALLKHGVNVELFAARVDGETSIGLEDVTLHELSRVSGDTAAARERAALEANDELRTVLLSARPFDLIYERYSLWCHAAMEHAMTIDVAGVLEVNAPLIEEQIE